MVEIGILSAVDETGKGGHRLRFSPRLNELEVKEYFSKIVIQKLKEMTEENSIDIFI